MQRKEVWSRGKGIVLTDNLIVVGAFEMIAYGSISLSLVGAHSLFWGGDFLATVPCFLRIALTWRKHRSPTPSKHLFIFNALVANTAHPPLLTPTLHKASLLPTNHKSQYLWTIAESALHLQFLSYAGKHTHRIFSIPNCSDHYCRVGISASWLL